MSEPSKEDLLRHDKILAEIDNLMAQSRKLGAETSKINKENQWYIAIVASTVTLAIVAIVKIFL